MSASFRRRARVAASTLRDVVGGDGKSSGPAEYLSGLLVTPIVPVEGNVQRRVIEERALNNQSEILQTFVAGSPDIVAGDVLVVGSQQYPVHLVGQWDGYLALMVEKAKG